MCTHILGSALSVELEHHAFGPREADRPILVAIALVRVVGLDRLLRRLDGPQRDGLLVGEDLEREVHQQPHEVITVTDAPLELLLKDADALRLGDVASHLRGEDRFGKLEEDLMAAEGPLRQRLIVLPVAEELEDRRVAHGLDVAVELLAVRAPYLLLLPAEHLGGLLLPAPPRLHGARPVDGTGVGAREDALRLASHAHGQGALGLSGPRPHLAEEVRLQGQRIARHMPTALRLGLPLGRILTLASDGSSVGKDVDSLPLTARDPPLDVLAGDLALDLDRVAILLQHLGAVGRRELCDLLGLLLVRLPDRHIRPPTLGVDHHEPPHERSAPRRRDRRGVGGRGLGVRRLAAPADGVAPLDGQVVRESLDRGLRVLKPGAEARELEQLRQLLAAVLRLTRLQEREESRPHGPQGVHRGHQSPRAATRHEGRHGRELPAP
jgi:hypothetical protein